MKKPAAGLLRRGLDGCDDGYTLLICPTSQIVLQERLAALFHDAPANEKARGRIAGRELIIPTIGISN